MGLIMGALGEGGKGGVRERGLLLHVALAIREKNCGGLYRSLVRSIEVFFFFHG